MLFTPFWRDLIRSVPADSASPLAQHPHTHLYSFTFGLRWCVAKTRGKVTGVLLYLLEYQSISTLLHCIQAKSAARCNASREKYFGSVSLTNRRSSAACPRSDRRGSTGAVSAVWRHGRARGLRNGNEGELATQASSSLLSIGSLVRDLSLLCTACSMCPETLLTVPPLGVGRGG